MDYYSHTIRITNFDYIDISRIDNIIKSGYIYSRRKMKEILGINNKDTCEETSLFNGMDYISLCDLSKKHERYSAYYMYVYRGLSFLFSKNIDVIVPTIVNTNVNDMSFIYKAHEYGQKINRYSDLYDEVQVKDKLSLDYLKGMSISLRSMRIFHDKKYLFEYLKALKEVLEKNNLNIPIYNLDTKKELLVDKTKIKIRDI